ncbi:MAG: SDR family oxidoreductase [Candidatus Bathyarchaeia archaeon]|nr:SDR family oxidoreductase [Candidatus Bathyarchaeota archaeon]
MKKVKGRPNPIDGKVTVVVGGASGIGKGIALNFALNNAYVAVLDIARDAGEKLVSEINKSFGKERAKFIYCDVSVEETIKDAFREVVHVFSGIDVLIYSVGIVKAGSVKDYSLEDFELVTKINYTGYFLCVKYAASIMAEQHRRDPSRIMDIIQINSKSGLQGSERNFAYSGSKFGGIGLTQSFALELWKDGIKVNAVCPGNVFDSPLWSDAKNGLFVQYLKAGKVPGAKTVEDVRRYYESKVPMGRGCTVEDILCTVYYLIEQKYETGQAILVAGGQIMR